MPCALAMSPGLTTVTGVELQSLRQVAPVGRLGPLHQLRHLRLELGLQLLGVAVTHGLVARGIGVHLGPIQAHRTELEHSHRPGVAQHLNEDRLNLLQEALAEIVDRVVIRVRVPRDVAKCDRVIAGPFQGSAGEVPVAYP
jgi:hypothetical protein